MFLVNGIPLDNPEFGWGLLQDTQPRPGFSYDFVQHKLAGRDGSIMQPPVRSSTMLKFVIGAPRTTLPALYALFDAPVLEISEQTQPGRVAAGVLASSTPIKENTAGDYMVVGFSVQIPDGCYRTQPVTSTFTPATSSGATLNLLSGITAPVQDAIVRIKGGITHPQVTDSQGSFFVFEQTLQPTQFLRFHADTGRAWITSTDTWEGGEEVSGLIDFGGKRGLFELTPAFTNPNHRTATVRLTQQTHQPGAGFQIRAKNTHLI